MPHVLSLCFLRPAPRTQSTHERALQLVPGADFWRDLQCFSSRSPSQGSRGPPRAPRGGAENRQKNGPGFITLFSRKSAQVVPSGGPVKGSLEKSRVLDRLRPGSGASGQEIGFRAGFQPDSDKENLKIGIPAGRSQARRDFPDLNPAEIRPGNSISGPEALLGNVRKHVHLFYRPYVQRG